MEEHTTITPSTSAYTENHYEIAGGLSDLTELPAMILSHKLYRVVAGRLYIVQPGSPPERGEE